MRANSILLSGVAILAALASAASTAMAVEARAGAGRVAEAKLPISTTPTPGEWRRVGETDRYEVDLVRGRAYAFRLDEAGDGGAFTLTLRDVAGRVLREATGDAYAEAGFEFVAPAAGTYSLDAKLLAFDDGTDGAYHIVAGPDCVAGARTTCRLRIGKAQERLILFNGDVDLVRVTLAAGRRYTFDAAKVRDLLNDLELTLLDPRGRVVATGSDVEGEPEGTRRIADYLARTSGDHFIRLRETSGETWGPYRLSARTRR